MTKIFSYIAALTIVFFMSSAASAAKIERYVEQVMGCSLLLSGVISDGDAQNLDSLVKKMQNEENAYNIRICLNSPGGSFAEGVRLAQVIRGVGYLGTSIAEGHVCESACAVVFMAGGWTEGGFDTVRPILHPRARLGFHAPSLSIANGQYTESQVAEAYAIALQSVAKIVEMRSEGEQVNGRYKFPENLFFKMISTPPNSMFYIDTVEKAAAFDIAVFPVGVNSEFPVDALRNLCMFTFEFKADGNSNFPEIVVSSSDRLEVYFDSGFGEEAANPCRLVIDFAKISDFNLYFHSRDRPILAGHSGENVRGENYEFDTGAYPYMTFDGSTELKDLPIDIEGSWKTFISRVGVERPRFQQCWLQSSGGGARVANVNDYVNFRSQPDFSSAILRQVPLGELVQLGGANNLTVTGHERSRESCIIACQALGNNPGDAEARDIAQQCIDDNMLWYEVTDARGNSGWLSRKFLEEVE